LITNIDELNAIPTKTERNYRLLEWQENLRQQRIKDLENL